MSKQISKRKPKSAQWGRFCAVAILLLATTQARAECNHDFNSLIQMIDTFHNKIYAISETTGSKAEMQKVLDEAKDCTEKLIDEGANIEDSNENGTTPLMAALYAGFDETTRILLERGADRNAADHFGKTPENYLLGKPSFLMDLIYGHYYQLNTYSKCAHHLYEGRYPAYLKYMVKRLGLRLRFNYWT